VTLEYAALNSQLRLRGCWWWLHPCRLHTYLSLARRAQVIWIRRRFVLRMLKLLATGQWSDAAPQAGSDSESSEDEPEELHSEDPFSTARLPAQDLAPLVPLVEMFSFDKYLRRNVRANTLRLLEVDWKLWGFVLLLCIFNLVRHEAHLELHSNDSGVSLFIAAGARPRGSGRSPPQLCRGGAAGVLVLVSFFVIYVWLAWKLSRYFALILSTAALDEDRQDR
jgi:hypothetical protein